MSSAIKFILFITLVAIIMVPICFADGLAWLISGDLQGWSAKTMELLLDE